MVPTYLPTRRPSKIWVFLADLVFCGILTRFHDVFTKIKIQNYYLYFCNTSQLNIANYLLVNVTKKNFARLSFDIRERRVNQFIKLHRGNIERLRFIWKVLMMFFSAMRNTIDHTLLSSVCKSPDLRSCNEFFNLFSIVSDCCSVIISFFFANSSKILWKYTTMLTIRSMFLQSLLSRILARCSGRTD